MLVDTLMKILGKIQTGTPLEILERTSRKTLIYIAGIPQHLRKKKSRKNSGKKSHDNALKKSQEKHQARYPEVLMT